MTEELEVLRRGELSAEDLNKSLSVLEEGKAVNLASARAELPIAPVVVLKRIDGKVVGLGAIKRQRPDYAADKARASGYDLDPNMHEVGYVAVRQAFGERGVLWADHGCPVVGVAAAAVLGDDIESVYGETLTRAGFDPRGEPWAGASGNVLRLWIRERASK